MDKTGVEGSVISAEKNNGTIMEEVETEDNSKTAQDTHVIQLDSINNGHPENKSVTSQSEKRHVKMKENKIGLDVIVIQNGKSDGENLMEYRSGEKKAPADSSTEDSSSDSDEADDEDNADKAENETTENKINKAFSRDESPEREKNIKLNRHGFEDIRTRGELLPEDLPPLEELTITVDETVEMMKVGSIKSIVGILVVIQTCENIPALNEDTILFVEGRKVLGQVFEVFGPIQTPWYSVRFNNDENIKNKELEVGMPVFCAPKEESFTRYVFVDSLKKIKGSDASWENNNEPPEKYLDFSDDETERAAKSKKKKKKTADSETGETRGQNGEVPNKRNRWQNEPAQRNGGGSGHNQGYRPRNPFQSQNMNGPRYPQGNVPYNTGQNYHPQGTRWRQPQDPQRNTPSPAQRFGGPPRFHAPMNQQNGDPGQQYNQGNIQQNNNMPRYGFNPMNGGGNNPRQNFSGNGMNACQPGVPNMVPAPSPTNFAGNYIQNNQVQNTQQFPMTNAPFRTDIPPPLFNQTANQNRFNPPQGMNNQNFSQDSAPPACCPSPVPGTQIQTNQHAPGSNPPYSQGAPGVGQFGPPPNSHPPNIPNSQPIANTQFSNQPAGQFRPNMNSQFSNAPVYGQPQTQFRPPGPSGDQGNQGGMNNQFTGVQGNMPGNQFANTPGGGQPNIIRPSNFHNNQGVRAPVQPMKIHSLNPRLDSNVPQGTGGPVRPAGRGYEEVQLGNLTPYRPEIVNRNCNPGIPGSMGQQTASGNVLNSGAPPLMSNGGNMQQPSQGPVQGAYTTGPFIQQNNMQQSNIQQNNMQQNNMQQNNIQQNNIHQNTIQHNNGLGGTQPPPGQGIRPMIVDQRYIQNNQM